MDLYDQSDAWTTRHANVGMRVAAYFPVPVHNTRAGQADVDHVLFCGTGTKFGRAQSEDDVNLYHVEFDDGDEQDFSEHELQMGIELYNKEGTKEIQEKAAAKKAKAAPAPAAKKSKPTPASKAAAKAKELNLDSPPKKTRAAASSPAVSVSSSSKPTRASPQSSTFNLPSVSERSFTVPRSKAIIFVILFGSSFFYDNTCGLDL